MDSYKRKKYLQFLDIELEITIEGFDIEQSIFHFEVVAALNTFY